MHNLGLLENIAVTLTVAFIGGLIVQRIGLPSIVGYLLAGVAIGPFTPGYLADSHTINQLAELGVIFLMYGVGLHFSFADLWKVRDVAIVGTLGQMLTMLALGYGLSQYWGWTPKSGLVLGLVLSIASTIVMLRGFMDKGWLNTPDGQVAVGWRVMEDIATVLMIMILPNLADTGKPMEWQSLGLALLSALGFLVVMLFVGKRFIPWLLLRVAHTRSRELFILAVLACSLGIALGAAQLFGVSLALGAFVAGAVVSESPLSHRVASDLLPFREAFSVLFFVSVGMMLDPTFLVEHIEPVLILTALVVIGKFIVSGVWVLPFPRPASTALVVAAGSCQIGEFSFILDQTGLSLGILDESQHALILAAALLSIVVNPFMLHSVDPLQRSLRGVQPLWRWLNRHGSTHTPAEESISDHVVVVGYGRVGSHIVDVMGELGIPYLVIDFRISRIEKLAKRGVPTLLGDTANSDILSHAALHRARLLVVTLPEEAATELTVAAARDIAPNLPIIARAATRAGVKRLSELGAQLVIHPELEGGLQVLRHTLLQLGFPLHEVRRYADTVRRENYEALVKSQGEHALLRDLLDASELIDIAWRKVPEGSPLAGKLLGEAALRTRTGATLVAIKRKNELMVNPSTQTVFLPGDRIGLLGNPEQLEAVERLLAPQPQESDAA
ncbi:cation:proton antiporter domain-containing protein [Methylocaldum szegediense]|uniref:Cation/proton antiporter YbaL n=1 Tax=Methylocaldum szegediense TaxID=73780 RepID=A0ABM9HYU8_9GAMM|nr:cation:proton antiporter [Methylocaldum szegediense]CAI8778081.1 putative cation/proton antiporter YbaL [Methylocaldum szegediense]